MPLSFPNTSRVYDETKQFIRFWGYDSAFEISFQIDGDVLRQIAQLQPDESSLLNIFDINRPKIERAAQSAYSRNRQNYYRLLASDF